MRKTLKLKQSEINIISKLLKKRFCELSGGKTKWTGYLNLYEELANSINEETRNKIRISSRTLRELVFYKNCKKAYNIEIIDTCYKYISGTNRKEYLCIGKTDMQKFTNEKEPFEKEYLIWEQTKQQSLMSRHTLSKTTNFITENNIDERMNVFALLNVIHYGDTSINTLAKKNYNNETALSFLFAYIKGKGIRVGWRTEYVLSKLNKKIVLNYINQKANILKESEFLKNSTDRILNNSVLTFLNNTAKEKDTKLSVYATEVLAQIIPV